MKATKAKKSAVEAPETNEEKQKALDAAISYITKSYGKGSIMKLGQNTAMNVSAIPTGSLTLDLALGIGGVPRGRIVEVVGPESSGKTTIALHIAAEAQKAGGVAAFIDAEHALDPVYAKALGVDIENLLVSQPDSGEQALEICRGAGQVGGCGRASSSTRWRRWFLQQEIDGDMGASHVGVAGTAYVAGTAQAVRHRSRKPNCGGHLHQPAARKGRRDVRQSRRPRPAVAR